MGSEAVESVASGGGKRVEPSDEQLALVAEHGSGPIERALAIVMLARRQGRGAELRELIEETGTS